MNSKPSGTSLARLRIGITIGLHDEQETLWNNGIKQNAVFLAEALKHCPNVGSVTLVNTTHIAITPKLPWDLNRWPTLTFDAAKDQLDVLIELGGQIDANQTDYLKRRGTRLVSYCCGFEYIHTMESVLFNRPLFGYNLFINQRYDGVWVIPQVAPISEHYFRTLRRRPTQVVPFVWDPLFVQARSSNLRAGGEYLPKAGPRRISIMEPNHNVVKFCMYPTFIVEEVYRRNPALIELMQVTNADRIARESAEFIAVMNHLDVVRQHKAVFLGRHDTPVFLAENTDVVVSHQLENALNYFYLEVCWQGYPLVHNADLCPDIGYYYQANDVQQGAAQLQKALTQHDARATHYKAEQRQKIGRYLPGNPELVKTYNDLLMGLMQFEPI